MSVIVSLAAEALKVSTTTRYMMRQSTRSRYRRLLCGDKAMVGVSILPGLDVGSERVMDVISAMSG